MKANKVKFVEESLEDTFNRLPEDDLTKKAIIYQVDNLWIYNLPSS